MNKFAFCNLFILFFLKLLEKLCVKASRSTLNKRKKHYGNILCAEHQIRLEKIKKAHYEFKISGSKDSTLKILLKTYKADLRNLEKFQHEKLNRSKSFYLDRIMYENRNNFWNKINAHRKTNSDKNMVVSNIKLADFSNFYRNLFTHVERLNSLGQEEIERNVKAHYESIEKKTIKMFF